MQNNIDRRDFLKVSALASGGMLVGFNLFQSCTPSVEAPTDLSKLNYHDFNAYLKIAENGAVTIFSPNPEVGQGVKTSMPMILAEELCVSWSMVHVVQGNLDTEHYKRQVAGGSQSIRKSWMPLRQTGATARQMLVNAAAAKLQVSPAECTIADGVVTAKNGKSIGIGLVVNEAAKLEVPTDVKLKKPGDFTIVGQNARNVDRQQIVTGKPLYGMDLKQDGMLHACMLRAPFGYVLESFGADAAKAVEGVTDVFAFMDNNIAILAHDTFTAMKAAKLVQPKWKAEKTVPSYTAENKRMLSMLHESKWDTHIDLGTVDKAFDDADEIIDRTYETPYLPHSCLEPMNFFAHVQPEKVLLIGPIQTPEWTAHRVAQFLERDISQVSLEMTRIGGGFGRRLYGNYAVEAAAISQKAQKPIKLVYSREDDMLGGVYRPALNFRVKVGIKEKALSAYHFRQVGQSPFREAALRWFPAGSVENYRVESTKLESNITTGAWRAPISNVVAFAEQCAIDELAEKLQKDPIDHYLELLEKAKNSTEKIDYEPKRMAEVVRLVAEKSKWGKPEKGVFQGFAAYYCHNSYAAEVAEVVLKDGVPVIKRVVCALDCGIVVNPIGAQNQVAGGIIDGIGHAMYGQFPIENGLATATNFDKYRLIRMAETPQVEGYFVESDIAPTGLGEPTLPPAGAAVANAIYAATGVRITKQPFVENKEVFG